LNTVLVREEVKVDLLVEPVVLIAVSRPVFVWNAVTVSNIVDVTNVVLNAVVVSNTEEVVLLV
jgi:hypothetical protein